MSSKQTSRQDGKPQGLDSPKSTIKVAPVDKGKESFSLFESTAKEKNGIDAEAESYKFREDIKLIFMNMDETFQLNSRL